MSEAPGPGGGRRSRAARSLLDAIYRRYHYDFRCYSEALAPAAARAALTALRLQTLLEPAGARARTSPRGFRELLRFLTVQVTDLFRDPSYFRALRESVVPYLADLPVSCKMWVAGCATGEEAYSFAILLARGGPARPRADLRHRHQPESLRAAEAGVYDLERFARFSENYRLAGGAASLVRLLHRARTRRAVLDRSARAGRSCSPTTASPPTASFAEVRAGVVPQRAHLLRARAPGSRDRRLPRLAAPPGLPRAWAPRRRCASRCTPAPSPSFVPEDRIYQKVEAR